MLVWNGALLDDWLLFILFALAGGVCAWRAAVVREERVAWLLVATGLELYAFGGVVYVAWVSSLQSPPFPSLADWFWLAMYPWVFAGLVGLVRARGLGSHASVWLDGLVVRSRSPRSSRRSCSSRCGSRRWTRTPASASPCR